MAKEKHPAPEEGAAHEHDAFVRLMHDVWHTVRSRQRTVLIGLLCAAAALIGFAVVSAVEESRTEARLNATDTAETIEEMEHAAAAYPSDAALALRLGRAYVSRDEEGDIGRAEGQFTRAAEVAGSGLAKGVATLALGKLKMDGGEYETALVLFDEVSSMPEGRQVLHSEAAWLAGRCLELLGRPGQALARYEAVGIYDRQRTLSLWQGLAEYRRIELQRVLPQ